MNPFKPQDRLTYSDIPFDYPKERTAIKKFVRALGYIARKSVKKLPAISETIDWARTLVLLHAESLEPELVKDTLNVILKFQEDIDNVQSEVNALAAKITK